MVTVNDNEPPVLSSCPADITTTEDPPGSGSAVVNYSTPTASDNCNGTPPVSCTPPSGSTFPIGTTPVTCSASDSANNTGTCSFNVTVNSAPVQADLAVTKTDNPDPVQAGNNLTYP
jgi:hypothetical protein